MGRTIVNGACVIRDGSGDAESSVPESGRGGARGEEGGGHVTPGCYSKQPGLPPLPRPLPSYWSSAWQLPGTLLRGAPSPRCRAPAPCSRRRSWARSLACGLFPLRPPLPPRFPASSPSRVTSLGPPPPAVLPALLPPPAGAGRPQMPARVLLTRLPRHDTVAGRPRQQLCSSRLSGLEGQGQATGCGPGGRPLLAWTMLPSSSVLTWPFKVPVGGGEGEGGRGRGHKRPAYLQGTGSIVGLHPMTASNPRRLPKAPPPDPSVRGLERQHMNPGGTRLGPQQADLPLPAVFPFLSKRR